MGKQHQQRPYYYHSLPAAADSLEDGLSPLFNSRRYDDDPDDKHSRRGRRRQHGRHSWGVLPWAGLLLLVVMAGASFVAWRSRAIGAGAEGSVVARAKAVAAEAFNVKTLVMEAGLRRGLAQEEQEPKEQPQQPQQQKKEESRKPLPRSIETWEERQASGRHVLATGVDVALQELTETRGFANTSRVRHVWFG